MNPFADSPGGSAGREGAWPERRGFVPCRFSAGAGLGSVSEGPVRYNGREVTLKGGGDRFVLPPEFRRLVRQSSDGQRVLCLQIHPDRPCLMAFGLSRKTELEAQIDKEEANAIALGSTFNREDREIDLFSFETFPFDDSGRFNLPADFLDHAGISDKLYFQGAGPNFLIYSPETIDSLGAEHATLKRNCAGAMARFMAGKGAK